MKKFLFACSILVLAGCSVVGPGERGVRISLGKASDEVKEPGAYLWIPFIMGMAQIDVQTQKSEIETSAASKDMQEITTHIAVNWNVEPAEVVKAYRQLGDEEQILARIIMPAVSEVMKSATAKKTAEEILVKRLELKTEIDDVLRARLKHYGIVLSDASIMNLTFSKEFTDAIEQKQIAEQKAKQAEYVTLEAIQDAKAQVNRAKGQAESQALLRASLTPEILQQRAIDKWNGAFPQVMGTGATVPFLNLKGL